VDAYMLVHQAEDDVIDRLKAVDEVRFAARTIGAHIAVVVVSALAIADVVALVKDARRWGVVAYETAIPLRPNPPSIKVSPPKTYEAFVGLTVNPSFGHIQGAVDALRKLDIVVAVHAVAGRYQVMAELASEDYHELREALLLDLPSVPRIRSITSSLAVCRNAPASLQAQAGETAEGTDWFWRKPGRQAPPRETPRQPKA
jgi:DNA-binding Lrp family transcriptional regulator